MIITRFLLFKVVDFVVLSVQMADLTSTESTLDGTQVQMPKIFFLIKVFEK